MSTVDGRHEQVCALLTFDGNNAMYDNLKSLGISNPDDIDRYSLRQEANNDILKIYFRKDKGEFSRRASNSNIRASAKRLLPITRPRATKKFRK